MAIKHKSFMWNDSHDIDVDITFPKNPGSGIKVDKSVPVFGFRDILGAIETRGIGATDPDWTQIGATSFSAYKFSLNDLCWMAYHIPHDYAPNTDVFFHTHWLADGTDANTVKWEYIYTYAKGHNQQAFNLTGTTVYSEQASPAQYQHMVSETAAVTISGIEPDGIIYVRIRRVANGGTDNTDGIFVLTADVHYQSTNIATKNRTPNFYA